MKIAWFGSSLVSAYWNGAATYYRGLVKALHERGHEVTFYEPDAYQRQEHRDIEDPDWAKVVVYPATLEAVASILDDAQDADVIIKASGVGVFDVALEAGVIQLKRASKLVIFWDVDAPATLQHLEQHPEDPFHELIHQYDLILTYGGGEPVVNAYLSLGAKRCMPIYNAFDPTTHYPVEPDARFKADLAFMGNRLPDREKRVEEFLLVPAKVLPTYSFVLGGSGWGDKKMSRNIHYIGHVYTTDHNAFNSTPMAVLNISRESMSRFGFSPATRVFEAAAAGACIITDAWEGIGQFLKPDDAILVARNGQEVAALLQELTPSRAHKIGQMAREHVLSHHTYAHRIEQLESLLMQQGVSS